MWYLHTRIIQGSKQSLKNIILIFSFEIASLTDVEKEMKNWDTNKVTSWSDKHTKFLKQKVDFFSLLILGYVNKSISLSSFPSILKLADITPAYKKHSWYEKSYYQPISALPNLSKIFENILYHQISPFCGNIFSKYQTGKFPESLQSTKLPSSNDRKIQKITRPRRRISCITYRSVKSIQLFTAI